jgi:hypothetical protein
MLVRVCASGQGSGGQEGSDARFQETDFSSFLPFESPAQAYASISCLNNYLPDIL